MTGDQPRTPRQAQLELQYGSRTHRRALPNFPLIPSDLSAGWVDLLDEIIAILDKNYPGEWQIDQVKQKLAALDIHWRPLPHARHGRASDHTREVRRMIEEVERRSLTVCDICGEPGGIVGVRSIRTRCTEHAHDDDVYAGFRVPGGSA